MSILFKMRSNLLKTTMLVMVFMLIADALYAATYYSRATGLVFTSNSLWSTTRDGATVNYPGTSHTYIIQAGHSVTLGANQTTAGITIEDGGTLAPNGNYTLTSPLTIDAGGVFLINATRITMAGNTINDGTITITNGRLIRGTFSLTNSGSITMGAGQFTATTGTFTNESTGTMTVTGTATITLGTGTFTNNNTSASVNFGSSVVTLTGTVTRSVGGFTTTGRFSANNTGGTITLTGNINCNGITRNGTGGTVDMGAGLSHTTTGTVILTAGTMNGGTSTINVNIISTTAWQGTASLFVPQTSTVNFGAAGNQTLSATGTKTFYNLTFSNSGVKTNASTTVNNIFSLEGTATASVAPTYGTDATLRYNTETSRTAGAEWLATFAALGGVIIDNTGAITTNGNKVFNLNVPLTINSGATLTPAAGHTFSFGGDLINDGTWTASTGAVTINLARVSQSIGRFSTSGLVTMSKTSGTATFAGNINGGAFTMNGAGILNLGTGLTHTFTGNWTNTAGTLQGNTSTLNIGGTGSGTGVTFTAGTSTVNFNGAGAQNIPAFTYNNLTTSTGNTKTLLGTATVSGVLTINASTTLDLGAVSLTLSGAGTPLVNSGTFTSGTSTVNFSNAGSVNIPALNYYNLDITGGERILANSGTIGIAGTFTPGSGGFMVTGSTVELNGAAQTIPEFTFNDLVLSGSGAKTILTGTTATVNTIAILNGPTMDIEGTGAVNITNP